MSSNKNIINKIRETLLNDWDPIGIGDNQNLTDEYDTYIGRIYSVVKSGDKDAVLTLLTKIENEEMGTIPNIEKNRLVTQKLLKLLQESK